MSGPEAYDAIHDYLASAWVGPALAFENDGFQLPATPDYWILVEIFGELSGLKSPAPYPLLLARRD